MGGIPMPQGQPTGGSASPEEVEVFCSQYRLDARALRALKEEHPIVQKAVIDCGHMIGCHNPSGVVLSRIKAARRSVGNFGAMTDIGSTFPPKSEYRGFPY